MPGIKDYSLRFNVERNRKINMIYRYTDSNRTNSNCLMYGSPYSVSIYVPAPIGH